MVEAGRHDSFKHCCESVQVRGLLRAPKTLFFLLICSYVWEMQPWVTEKTFDATPKGLKDIFAPRSGWGTTIPAVSPWTATQKSIDPPKPFENDESLKKHFGVEWAKCEKPFEAACRVFETDTSAAVWIASKWLTDPVVLAAKDVYLKQVEAETLLLDKDAFAVKLMKLSEESVDTPRGRAYLLTGKERIEALKLYADVRGFLAKDSNTVNNFNNNEGLKVVFVKAAEQAPVKIIDQVPNDKSEMLNDYPSPIKIKLVGNG